MQVQFLTGKGQQMQHRNAPGEALCNMFPETKLLR